jgi:hypothetical protein
MLGYIISDKNEINVGNHEIQRFDILHKTDLNIFVIKNNKVLYKNYIIVNASIYGHIEVLEWFKNSGYEFKYDVNAIKLASPQGHIQVLEWFKNSGYEFKYDKDAICWAYKFKQIKILKFFSNNINLKKLIKILNFNIFISTVKFKTKINYLKGYKKN